MGRAKKFTISLTAEEAKILWGFLDGAMDAGANTDGGNSEKEQAALYKMSSALLTFARPAP
jgi:hypothetical protein